MKRLLCANAMTGILNLWVDMMPESATISIPNLQGLQLTAVRSMLENMGLRVECYYSHSNLPEGSIVAQNPVAGKQVSYGSSIVLAVGSKVTTKKELLRAPGVVGLSYDMAVEILKIEGFDRIHKVANTKKNHPLSCADIVTAQIPSKGEIVERNIEIFLEVNESLRAF